jgi:thiaminase
MKSESRTRVDDDAIEAYVSYLRKSAHTRKMRASYAAAARDSRAIAELWKTLDDDSWAQLDRKHTKRTPS